MFLDALAFHALWRELEGWLVGSYLQKIWQTGPDDYLLAAYRPGSRPAHPLLGEIKNLRLRLSLVPAQPFVHPWLHEKPPAQVPSSFCMLVRKHCLGKPILSLRRAGLERVVGLGFPGHILVIEMWERRPNLLLCRCADENGQGWPAEPLKILGGHRLGCFERKLLPGRPYSPPEGPVDSQPGPGDIPLEPGSPSGDPAKDIMLKSLFGLSPSAVEEFLSQAGVDPAAPWGESVRAAAADHWKVFWDDFWGLRVRPGITPKQRLTCWRGPNDEAVDSMFAGAVRLGRASEDGNDESPESHWHRVGSAPIARSLKAALKKIERKIEAIAGDLAKVSQADILKQQADLLLTYLPREGAEGIVHLPLWDGSGTVQIVLEPGLTPSQQAQHLYTQAKKYRRSQAHLEPRLAALRGQKLQLEDLRDRLMAAQTPAQLEGVAANLAALTQERATASRSTPTSAKEKPLRPISYRFEEFTILVGRNPRQNDLLVTRLAARDDLWLHVREGMGAHVLLKGLGPSKAPTMEAIEAAALLAARHSSRKADSKVEVVFLPASKVKKPPGSPPGYVIYHNEMSLTVDPEAPDPSPIIRQV